MRTTPLLAVLAAAVVATASAGPAAAADELVPVDKFFKGKVLKVDGRSVEIAYDFSSPLQLDDFELTMPFRDIKTVKRSLDRGQLRIEGTGGLRHKAIFDDKIGASVTVTPNRDKDFGFAVTEERESEVFTLYCLYDRYFSKGDNVDVPQNMIIKFIPRDPKINKDGFQDWRYCGSRGQKPEIKRGKSYKVDVERGKNQSKLVIDDGEGEVFTAKGKEASRDLTTQMFHFYVKDSDYRADDLVIRGTLHADYVAKHRIDLASWKPPEATPTSAANGAPAPGPTVMPEAEARLRAKLKGYPGETKPSEMAGFLRDAKLTEALRNEVAQTVVTVGQKGIAPFLVDGLYGDQDETSRKLCSDILTKLGIKTFGYKWDGAEDARKKAISGIIKYLNEHATEFR